MSYQTRQGGPDERYGVPFEANRRGAHRARPNSAVSFLPLVGVVAVVVGVLWLAVTLFGGGGGTTDPSALDQSGVEISGGAVAPGKTPLSVRSGAPRITPNGGAGQGAGAQITPQGGGAPQPTPTGGFNAPNPAITPGVAGVDKTLTLNFFNGSSPQIPGLSRKAVAKITAAGGWKVGTVLPWSGPAVSQTTVFYANETQRATAAEVVRLIGAGVPVLSPQDAAKGIAVVVASDYPH